MHWLYLAVSIVFIGIASRPQVPGWAVVLLVLGALVLFIAWMLAWTSSRISGASRDDVQMITAEELRHMREQAEARKAPAAASNPPPSPPDEPAS